ncbi:hypothetical protein PPERSA_00446 [Pseudocohnilembus persalinus]|uniref:Uncharacterized protein n=1 Tax=Pseudocohnilembus persalinus TaxID=266149 RepID=A0A0V0R6Y7_PSEPJ|nr:hypothetical protein PPERSA_00446 [Pseudocohnilembus persalinus]|eukprot:KRX10249.1 hypothetical protein PPERSA_00446 [Pseudocohnilembus persalinus]
MTRSMRMKIRWQNMQMQQMLKVATIEQQSVIIVDEMMAYLSYQFGQNNIIINTQNKFNKYNPDLIKSAFPCRSLDDFMTKTSEFLRVYDIYCDLLENNGVIQEKLDENNWSGTYVTSINKIISLFIFAITKYLQTNILTEIAYLFIILRKYINENWMQYFSQQQIQQLEEKRAKRIEEIHKSKEDQQRRKKQREEDKLRKELEEKQKQEEIEKEKQRQVEKKNQEEKQNQQENEKQEEKKENQENKVEEETGNLSEKKENQEDKISEKVNESKEKKAEEKIEEEQNSEKEKQQEKNEQEKETEVKEEKKLTLKNN